MSLFGAGLLAIALAATLGGFGGTEADGQATTTAQADAPGSAGAEVLAIQTGSKASLRRRPGGRVALVIERPSPRTLYFADSPGRSAQTAPVRRLPAWVKRRDTKQGHPPNVALSWQGRKGPASLSATLRGISYAKGRLRATLDPLRTGSGAPASLGSGRRGIDYFSNRGVSMVVDGSSLNRCYAHVNSSEKNFWTLESSSAEHDAWARRPPETIVGEGLIGSQSSSSLYGCEFTARYGDGEGNGFTIWVDNPWVGSAKYSCTGYGKATCNVLTWAYYEEDNEAHLQAEIVVLG